MSFEICPVSKQLITLIIFIRLFCSVCKNMVFDMSNQFKPFTTSITFMWSFSSVNKNQNVKQTSFFHAVERTKYVDIMKSRNERSLDTNLKISVHKLATECGRYTNIPEAERFCQACNQVTLDNEIED